MDIETSVCIYLLIGLSFTVFSRLYIRRKERILSLLFLGMFWPISAIILFLTILYENYL